MKYHIYCIYCLQSAYSLLNQKPTGLYEPAFSIYDNIPALHLQMSSNVREEVHLMRQLYHR